MSEQDDVIASFGARYKIPKGQVIPILNATCFKVDKNGKTPTIEQSIALIVVCDVYDLNPFTKEIYAFLDTKKDSVIPVVSVDGWIRLINSNPMYDGIAFEYSEETWGKDGLADLRVETSCWLECSIFRKDRTRPTTVREYLEEVYRPKSNGYGGPWQSHTNRMLRHKVLIQCARIAFGFAGIYDEDEAQRILRDDDDLLLPPLDQATPTSLVELPEATPDATPVVAEPVAAETPPVETTTLGTGEVVDQSTGEILPPAAAEPHSATLPNAPAKVTSGGTPITPERRRMLATRMEFNDLDEEAMQAKFGFTLDGVTAQTFSAVGNWIEGR